MTPAAQTAPTRPLARPLLLAAVLLAAFNLRPAMASLPPLLDTIRADLGLDHAVIGVLAAIPILCMGLMPIVGNAIGARFGSERPLHLALIALTLALAARIAAADVVVLFASAFAGGSAAAIAQTLMPPSVKRGFGATAPSIMGFAAVTMTIGAGVPSGTTAYLAAALGSWPLALAAWSIPALAAVVLWSPVAAAARGAAEAPSGFGLPLRDATAWRITVVSSAAFGLFWSLLSWLPAIYAEAGWSESKAGLLVAANLAAQMPFALLVSALAPRFRDRRPPLAAGILLAAASIAGLALWPTLTDWAPWAWSVAAGIGIGVIFPLALILPVDYGGDPGSVRRLAAMSLSVGYLIAGLGPLAIGWLRGATGGYTAGLLMLAAFGAVTLLGLRGLRPPARSTG